MKASIGSISEGTTRMEDLIPAFTEELERLDKEENEYKELITEANNLKDYETEQAEFVLNDLFVALDDYALPYTYFGTARGDAASYGYWIDWDSIENDVYDKELLRVDDLNGLDSYTGDVLEVNDHGNATLWRCEQGKLTEVWAVV